MRRFKHKECNLILRHLSPEERSGLSGEFQFRVIAPDGVVFSGVNENDYDAIFLKDGDTIHFDGSPIRWFERCGFEEIS